jgi:preprotein translocase SecE subunit
MGVKKFTQEVIKEGKRVRWPKMEVLVPAFIVVVLIAAIVGLLLMGEDALGKGLIDVLKKTFNN